MSIDTSKGHPAMDYAEHEKTYQGFIRWSIVGTVGTIGILALMAFFLL